MFVSENLKKCACKQTGTFLELIVCTCQKTVVYYMAIVIAFIITGVDANAAD
jgi:hypothetical protein